MPNEWDDIINTIDTLKQIFSDVLNTQIPDQLKKQISNKLKDVDKHKTAIITAFQNPDKMLKINAGATSASALCSAFESLKGTQAIMKNVAGGSSTVKAVDAGIKKLEEVTNNLNELRKK